MLDFVLGVEDTYWSQNRQQMKEKKSKILEEQDNTKMSISHHSFIP